tara:strand:+ start:55 stop:1395 length:1341 start_codon:yes stop_codon:yes gene_type:complete
MNFGEEVYRIVTSFREFDVTVKAATSRSTTFIVKGPDRASMQKKVEDSFVKSKIPNNKITREKVGASSFPATVVNLTNDKIIILYKPVRKGADRGALQTRNVESAQCLYAALVFRSLKRKIKVEDVSVSNFEKCKSFIDVDAKFEDMINISEDWINSSIQGANELYSNIDKNVNWIFHRGSRKVSMIESKLKELNRKEKLFSNINKWSPADFYLVSNTMSESDWRMIQDAPTIKGLNQLMVNMINDKKLIGVSLKKIAKGAKPFKYYNMTKDRNAGDIQYAGTIIFKKPDNPLSAMDTFTIWKPGGRFEIQWRSDSGGPSGWKGEIQGTAANQGKISFGPLNKMLKYFGLSEIPNYTNSPQLEDVSLMEEIYDDIQKIQPMNLTKEEFVAQVKNKDAKWRFAKYTGVKFAKILESQSGKMQNKIVQEMYFYANSQSPNSGPYGKIE